MWGTSRTSDRVGQPQLSGGADGVGSEGLIWGRGPQGSV